MCRLCEIGKLMEEANSEEDAFGILEDVTFNTVMDNLSKDDVYHFLLRKYRDEAIMNMEDHEFKELLQDMELAGRAEPSVPGKDKLDALLKKKSNQLH